MLSVTKHAPIYWQTVYDRENKELKGKQAKQSVDSVKTVVADKAIKNKAERDRCVYN